MEGDSERMFQEQCLNGEVTVTVMTLVGPRKMLIQMLLSFSHLEL